MTIRAAINGYGRIGRMVLRSIYEYHRTNDIQIVAVNNIGDLKMSAHLTQFDSTHGKFSEKVSYSGDNLEINQDKIQFVSERDPANLPWKKLDIDVVFECTGSFTSKEKSKAHLQAGAKKVLISAPAGNDVPTIVYGVNHHLLTRDTTIVSNASCTTNCLVPLAKPLHDSIGIEIGLMTTIHAYTNDQSLTDVQHTDFRRARSATQSLIPTKTGAASAIGLVLPELNGKLDGLAIRVPVLNVSLVDLTFTSSRETSVQEVNDTLRKASEGNLKGILEISELPLVSIDFNHNPASCIFDPQLTKVIKNQVKVLAWYDNEWGFSTRMVDTAIAMMNAR